jgi:hypothetical protein
MKNFGLEIRPYVVRRINGWRNNDFSEFYNNRGLDFNYEGWSHRYPTDSEIIMHLFINMLSKGFSENDEQKCFFADTADSFKMP